MKNIFLTQAIYLPFLYFGTVILAGLFAAEYSHIGQQVSELALNDSRLTKKILGIGIFATGLSIVAFGIVLLLEFKRQFLITSALIIVFGGTFLFGAIFAIGSPWHSVYGAGFCVVLLPFAFLVECEKESIDKLTYFILVFAAVVLLVYFWSLLAKLHPWDYRGLAQRIFGIAVFGSISRMAYALKQKTKT